ncbi:siroheme synthase [Tricholoma matsutake]|nr:siroheme synthase [Tricholoma matsutake 945]
MTDSSEPHSTGGKSLLIAWQLKDKNVLIVGGGEVAAQRIESILTTDAHIAIISPADSLHARTQNFISTRSDRITHYDRLFVGPEELNDMDMILTAVDDENLSQEICQMCRKAKIPVNAADLPELCDFYFGAQIRDGPLQIMISTNGNGPRMTHLIKKKLESALSGIEGQAIARLGELRTRLKTRAPGVGGTVSKQRMKWVTSLCDTWDMEELVSLDDTMMERLLDEGWEKNCVPTFEQLGGHCTTPILSNTFMTWPAVIGFATGAIFTILVVMSKRRD